MIFLTLLLLSQVSNFNLVYANENLLRPRGVAFSRINLYIPPADNNGNFNCFDGSRSVPFTYINDDFCDCADGSDEPGTSACPNGSFYCTNSGHKAMNIASSRVNDGICDCCDGSDEYISNSCTNNCLEMGKSAREEAARRAELIKAGKQLRAEMIQRGEQLKQEKTSKLSELASSLNEAAKVKEDKEKLKQQAEQLENEALQYYRKLEEEKRLQEQAEQAEKDREDAMDSFKKFDSNNDGKVDLNELSVHSMFDKDRDSQVSEEEARYFLNNADSVDLETFIKDCWPNMKQQMLLNSGIYQPPTPSKEKTPENENGDEQGDEEKEKVDDKEGPLNNDEEEEDDDELPAGEEEVEEEILNESKTPENTIQYDTETQQLIEAANAARNEYQEAESRWRSIEQEIKNVREYLDKDFGPEEEFAVLEGQCFDYTDHEYIYRLCPFDKTIQQPKSSSSETRLGTWGHWKAKEGSSDGEKYTAMMYERGQSCWNGPQRTTLVRIACGNENKLVAVSEPNRCEYVFDFTTPAACKEPTEEDQQNTDDLHDEL